MKQTESSPLGLYMIGIAALFLTCFLALVVLGAQTYRKTAGSQDDNYRTRAVLAYISSVVRANDASDAVSVRNDSPEGGYVLVAEDGSGYASRIYLHEGTLVEDYAETDAPYDPADAMKIGQTDLFEAAFEPEEGVLTVNADCGSVNIHLRSDAGLSDRLTAGEEESEMADTPAFAIPNFGGSGEGGDGE